MKPYQHFTFEERQSLAKLHQEGKSIRKIAEELGRSPSSVSREVKRNWSKKKNQYNPSRATILYIIRRKECVRKSRFCDADTKEFVKNALLVFWPPETIVARWKRENPGGKLSHSTIYRAIKRNELERIRPETHLRRKGKRRSNHNSQTIKPDHTIHERPECAALRSRLGDMEGDTVYGAVGKGCAITVVDRKSRMLYATLCKTRESAEILEGFKRAMDGTQVNTLTLDNGSEFARFREIEEALNTTVYFADPHSPWQRPTNENTNDILRFFYPKGTNFLDVSEEDFQSVIQLINNRPRKCLGWLSPIEALNAFCCT